MSKLRLRLSGTFDARLESHQDPIRSFRTTKARALLAYLAMGPNIPHSRQALSTLFWPDLDDKAASSNFRNTLSNFRRLFKPLPGLLTITRQTIELHSDHAWVDVLEFAENPALETIDLYKGDFLPGLNLYDAIAFEEWRTMQQERLHMLALLTLDDLIENKKSAGEHTLAIDLVHKQLAIEPWHEKGHFQLIQLLWQQGQRELAIQQYEQCEAILADELGITPSVGLQNLVEEIKKGQQLSATTIHVSQPELKHNLPQQPHPFIGRKSEIEQIVAELDQTPPPLLTLVGAGGVGKSRLALEVAQQYLTRPQSYPDGVYTISLAPLDDAEAIPLAIGEAIGYSFYESTLFRDQILDFLSTRSALLILDNVEHLLDHGSVFIRDLIARTPGCQLIATSRQVIDLAGESVFRIEGLASHRQNEALSEAEELYLLSAKRISKSYSPSDKDLEDIRRICQLVEGLPLAIVLAAGWINVLSAQEIADEIERDIDFLSSNQIDLPPRQRSLRATFAHTWWLLENEERIAYARLSVFRGGFTRQAAAHIIGASLRHLARLVSKSLLSYDPVRNRYFIHELLRQVSEAELDHFGAETVTAVRDAHTAYYLNAVGARESWFQGEKQQQAIRDIAADFANVRTAWRWAIKNEYLETMADILEPLFLFFFTSGREQDGVQEFERALSHLPRSGSDRLAQLRGRLQNRLFELAHLYKLPNRTLVQPLKQLFSHPRNDLELAIVMHQEAILALQQADIAAGIALFQKQTAVHREQHNSFRLGATLTNLGQLYFIAGDLENGRSTTLAALKLGRENGDRLTTALSLVILGAADFFWIGNIKSAKIRFLQVEEIGQEIRTSGQVITGFIFSKVYLSFIHLLDGELTLAEQYRAQAIALWAEKKTPLVNALMAGLDAIFAMSQGDYSRALEGAIKGISWSNRPGAVEFSQIALVNSACMLWETDYASSVLKELWIGTVQMQNLPNRSLLYFWLPAMAHSLAETGHPELAVKLISRGQIQPAYPATFLKRFELVQRTLLNCKNRLGETRFHALIAEGESAPFSTLSKQVIDAFRQQVEPFP